MSNWFKAKYIRQFITPIEHPYPYASEWKGDINHSFQDSFGYFEESYDEPYLTRLASVWREEKEAIYQTRGSVSVGEEPIMHSWHTRVSESSIFGRKAIKVEAIYKENLISVKEFHTYLLFSYNHWTKVKAAQLMFVDPDDFPEQLVWQDLPFVEAFIAPPNTDAMLFWWVRLTGRLEGCGRMYFFPSSFNLQKIILPQTSGI
jgi:hypothetical protein